MTAATVDRRGTGTYAAFCSSRSSPVAPELCARSNRAAEDRFAGLERGSALGSLRGSENMESTGHSQQLTGTMIGRRRHMEWALLDLPGVGDLIEYETRVNSVIPKYDGPVICTYDLTKFGASVVMDALRTHPFVIIGGLLQENPFFVSPDQLLLEIRERRPV